MSKADLICTGCPLLDCSEESLWCLYRLATDPNQAQLKVLMPTIKRVLSRQDYFANYYQINREKKLAAAKERYGKTQRVEHQS